MLFTLIILIALAATFTVVKFSKSRTQDSCCAHQPAEDTTIPTTHEVPDYVPTPRAVTEPLDVDVIAEVIPTTPPSAPVMAAKKKKKPQPKKKPAKVNA